MPSEIPTPTPPSEPKPAAIAASTPERPPFRLGVVRYFNTLPLIDGLDRLAGLTFRHEPPARLVELLEADEVDMALCSTIDLARSRTPLRPVPVGCLGCRGRTLTVRLFSRVPFASIGTLDADVESHTSVALAQIILRERHGAAPVVRPWVDRPGATEWSKAGDALLLIGDKAVLHAPPESEFPLRFDLGEAWAEMTELPFVFAVWMVREDLSEERRRRVERVAAVLDHQRRHNRTRIPRIVAEHAEARGWPRATAQRYLGELIDFEFTARHALGLECFLRQAHGLRLIDRAPALVPAAAGAG